MATVGTVGRKGVVSSIDGDKVTVEFCVESACATCHTKNWCTMDKSQRTIAVETPLSSSFEVGEEVMITLKRSSGHKAVMLSYVLPFVVLFGVLVLLVLCGVNEGPAVLAALLSLAAYYVSLFILRGKLKREFDFGIEKCNK